MRNLSPQGYRKRKLMQDLTGNWLVVSESNKELVLCSKKSGRRQTIQK